MVKHVCNIQNVTCTLPGLCYCEVVSIQISTIDSWDNSFIIFRDDVNPQNFSHRD